METILQHNISEQPVEWGVQSCLRENTKYCNADYATKTRRLKNSKYNGNNDAHDGTTHSRRQYPWWHWLSHEHHKTNRATDRNHCDREFTQDEVRQIIEDFNPRKAPGPDGITSESLTLIFKSIPKTVTSVYNECLKRGCFPKNWKIAKIIPITKPGKEDSLDPSKYRPISLLNIGVKVLEKLLINRIMHHVHKTDFLNDNQFGFILILSCGSLVDILN